MAVDTAAKRYSANAQRWGRLPFGRRFSPPLPDGTVGQGDRQHLAWAYSGILAGAILTDVDAVFVQTARGRCFIANRGRTFEATERGRVFQAKVP